MKSDRYARPIIPEAWTRGCYSDPSPIHRATARLIPDVTWYDIIKPLFGEFIARDRWRICGGDAIRNRDWSINVDRQRGEERERESVYYVVPSYRYVDKVRSNSVRDNFSISRFYFIYFLRRFKRFVTIEIDRHTLDRVTQRKKKTEEAKRIFEYHFKLLPHIVADYHSLD